ncbi:WAT1-related protein [Quillaja saponaria]|uniref:WAT1-related protein n=1 Tax=Quillaja saponaria TaxID=32244 RepID=A0AAD7L6T4_QUISA|nr:WAT1-related protein [Quillaja saponaria]
MVVGREVIEEIAIIGGLVGVQFGYAGNSVLLSYLMSLGLNPLSISILSSFATFLILFPFAVYFERCKWPSKFSLKLIIQLLLISLGGVTLFQFFFLKGINLTSAAMGTAMPNLAPGLIFIIAWICRLERVQISCLYSKVKILGTLLCVLGALTMSLMQSTGTGTATSAREAKLLTPPPDLIFDREKIMGCLYLLVAVFMLSNTIVLQASTLGDFPAPMSLCAITSLIGVFMTATMQLFEDDKLDTGWKLLSVADLIGYSLMGGMVTGASMSFNGWAMKKRGPVLVSMFSPIGTVCSVTLSVKTLGDTVNIGSLAGMVLMFTGLYFVLWAKGKEGYPDGDGYQSEFDAEKPLLS